jgi:hypothetical protein
MAACAADPGLGHSVGAAAEVVGLASDLLIATTLVGMHVEGGGLGAARRVVNRVSCPDTVAWNALIRGYARAGHLG